MKRDKIIYWITTGLVVAGMLLSASMYLGHDPKLMLKFESIGIPIYLVTLLGVAKLLGSVMLITPIWEELKEWAYAGFTFTFIGAIWTHVATGTQWMFPLLFLILLASSYIFRGRIVPPNFKSEV